MILGSSGMLGRTLTATARKAGYSVIAHAIRAPGDEYVRGDLTVPETAKRLLDEHSPDVVVNLVALTSVDQCEADIDQAFQINAGIPTSLAMAASRKTRLIHVSTDHVYDGCKSAPSRESETRLRNAYAVTKLAGELPILTQGSVVLRTNFFGPSYDLRRKSFSDAILNALEGGAGFSGFHDVFFSPLSMVRLSTEILRVAEVWCPGLYNLGSRAGLSKLEFARLVATRYGYDPALLKSQSIDDAVLPASRPRGMVMDVTAFESAYAAILPTLEDEIESLEL
ncbi:SDR family oxidoreductase [Parasphingorhabdus sp.]|uniref:SDR family oxidoreductase n=1 Tax=Parasphingorhabdus sp. TaxID=2709688 RepID=UPI003263FEE2